MTRRAILSSRESIWGGGEHFLAQIFQQLTDAGHDVVFRVSADSEIARRHPKATFASRRRPAWGVNLIANDFRSLWMSVLLDRFTRRIFVVHGGWQVSRIRLLIARVMCVRLLAVSRSVADTIDSYGICPPVDVLPLGPEVETLPQPPPDRANGGPVRVVTVARLDPVKRLELFCDVIERLNATGRPALGHIVTEQPRSEKQSDLLARVTSRPGVTCLVGAAPLSVVANSDVFLSTSLAESFGLAHLEALAAGVPIVSTALDGPADFMTDELAIGRVLDDDPATVADAVVQVLDRSRSLEYWTQAADILARRGPRACGTRILQDVR